MPILDFAPSLAALLPGTHTLLCSSNLTLHPSVMRVILHGSRGLAGGFRPDSDLDLSLLVDTHRIPAADLEALMQAVLATTLSNWRGPVEADLAAVFDVYACGLQCFEGASFDERLCSQTGVDCFGLYKLNRGFAGFVTHAGVDVRRMVPCLVIWEACKIDKIMRNGV